MEVFISTSDGKYAGLRYRGTIYLGRSPDELARELGISEYVIELDAVQTERDKKAAAKARLNSYNASLTRPWGY